MEMLGYYNIDKIRNKITAMSYLHDRSQSQTDARVASAPSIIMLTSFSFIQ